MEVYAGICALEKIIRTGERVQHLRAMVVLAENLSSVSRTHIAAHYHPLLYFKGIWCLPMTSRATRQAYNKHPYIQLKYLYRLNGKNKNFKWGII